MRKNKRHRRRYKSPCILRSWRWGHNWLASTRSIAL